MGPAFLQATENAFYGGRMKSTLLILLFTHITWASSYGVFYSALDRFGGKKFPTAPNENLTPGDLCRKADNLRYPEKIRYCNRSVSGNEKQTIIRMYDRELGFEIGQMNRTDFKIDHYIPLCVGGSNESENLWPQHRTVFQITDGLEGKLCELMERGKLTQAKAVETIKKAKNHLDEVPAIAEWLNSQF